MTAVSRHRRLRWQLCQLHRGALWSDRLGWSIGCALWSDLLGWSDGCARVGQDILGGVEAALLRESCKDDDGSMSVDSWYLRLLSSDC